MDGMHSFAPMWRRFRFSRKIILNGVGFVKIRSNKEFFKWRVLQRRSIVKIFADFFIDYNYF